MPLEKLSSAAQYILTAGDYRTNSSEIIDLSHNSDSFEYVAVKFQVTMSN